MSGNTTNNSMSGIDEDDYYPPWVYEDEQELALEASFWEEMMAGLYLPETCVEGEELSRGLLESNPSWQPALMYLTLFLAGQGRLEESLEVLDELTDEALFETLKHLAQGGCSEAEEQLYQAVIEQAQGRGLKAQVEEYFATVEEAIEWHEPFTLPGA